MRIIKKNLQKLGIKVSLPYPTQNFPPLHHRDSSRGGKFWGGEGFGWAEGTLDPKGTSLGPKWQRLCFYFVYRLPWPLCTFLPETFPPRKFPPPQRQTPNENTVLFTCARLYSTYCHWLSPTNRHRLLPLTESFIIENRRSIKNV